MTKTDTHQAALERIARRADFPEPAAICHELDHFDSARCNEPAYFLVNSNSGEPHAVCARHARDYSHVRQLAWPADAWHFLTNIYDTAEVALADSE